MPDMLVKLYALPPAFAHTAGLQSRGFKVRRAMAYEREAVVQWVRASFNSLWASECASGFGRQPIGCYIAVKDDVIKGFCCIETTFLNFIGPIGVVEDVRGQGLGKALAAACLEELRHMGYAYAIIGDAGHPAFFEKSTGAVEIADSRPGPYPPRLK